jgi:hypothetical protein
MDLMMMEREPSKRASRSEGKSTTIVGCWAWHHSGKAKRHPAHREINRGSIIADSKVEQRCNGIKFGKAKILVHCRLFDHSLLAACHRNAQALSTSKYFMSIRLVGWLEEHKSRRNAVLDSVS